MEFLRGREYYILPNLFDLYGKDHNFLTVLIMYTGATSRPFFFFTIFMCVCVWKRRLIV